MPTYPEKITAIVLNPKHARRVVEPDASGRAVNFQCGCFVDIELKLRAETVERGGFTSNGCGYLLAAAEQLLEHVEGRSLQTLPTLLNNEPASYPGSRQSCDRAALDALNAAFASLRLHRLDEYDGEEALICTCFGVSEKTIEEAISSQHLTRREQVTAATRAGGGCGACRMLIEEMLDARKDGVDML